MIKETVLGGLVAAALGAAACAQALEPVNPQPGSPLTYADPHYKKITPQVAHELMKKGNVVVLDVRTPEEVKTDGKIAGSVNVPLSELKVGQKLAAAPNLNQKILVHCKSGVRAEKAARILVETGYTDVENFYGTLQWPYGLEK